MGVPYAIIGVFLLFISLISPPASPANAASLPPDFHKGITYESWWQGEFASANSDQVLSNIIQPMGANWIALIVKCQQAALTATEINCDADTSATDDELVHVIQQGGFQCVDHHVGGACFGHVDFETGRWTTPRLRSWRSRASRAPTG